MIAEPPPQPRRRGPAAIPSVPATASAASSGPRTPGARLRRGRPTLSTLRPAEPGRLPARSRRRPQCPPGPRHRRRASSRVQTPRRNVANTRGAACRGIRPG